MIARTSAPHLHRSLSLSLSLSCSLSGSLSGALFRPPPGPIASPRPPAPAGGLSGITRELIEAMAGIDAQAWPAEKALALERIRHDHLDGLLDHLRQLPPHDAAQQRDQETASGLVELLAHGPELLRLFPGHRHLHDGWAWQQSAALRQRLRESAETFAAFRADPARRDQALAYAALVPSARHEEFLGQALRREEDAAVSGLRQAAGTETGLLSGEDVLLLRDYAHAQTRSFNFYRALHRLGRDTEALDVRPVFEELEDRLSAAVQRIWDLPAARCAGPLYKGWIPVPTLPLEKDAAFDIDRPLSATRDRAQSYALRRAREGKQYSAELEFQSGPQHRLEAVSLAAFHTLRTAAQGEAVLLPGQRFTVEQVGVERRQGPGGEGPAAEEPVTVHRLSRAADRHLPAG